MVDKLALKEALSMLKEAGFNVAYKNDPGSTSLANTGALQGPLQGNNNLAGAFAEPGVRPDRYSALTRVRSLAKLLIPEPNEFYQEKLSILTGATDSSGSNASDYCSTAPTPGFLKKCTQQFLFGKWFSQTHLNDVNDVGFLYNRADVPGTILNSSPEMYPLMPDIMWRLMDTRSQLQYELYTQGIMIERSLEQVLITGDPTKASANTQRGFMKEFLGLDGQIKTGYVDLDTQRPCQAADSIVISFNTSIGGTIGGGDGRTITTALGDLWYAAQDRAAQVGMADAEFVFIMRKELFRALTDYYANTYATSRFQAATLTAGSPVVQIATDQNDIRLEMLRGQYLLVEGIPVPVIFSDGMQFAGQGNNTYISDIFLVPVSWAGRRLLRLEFFNLGNQWSQEYVNFLNPQRRMVINNGLYAVGYQSTGFCDDYLFASQMRMILETPFLAGRLDDVLFTYQAATRNAIPGQSLYSNGGVSFVVPRGYAPTN